MEMIENKKLELLLREVFTLEIQKGHLKWKVSELARLCKVSKSLVYYHLGKSKMEILHSALDIVASESYGFSTKREEMVRKGNLFDSLKYTREMFIKTPSFTAFYFRWRLTKSDLGRRLQDIDDRYRKRLKLLFPHLSNSEVIALHAIFLGLVSAPVLDDAAMKAALKWIVKGSAS